MHCSHSCKIAEWKEISCALYKKDKMGGQNRSENTFFENIDLSFLHRGHGMSFHSENLHECEQLICVCLQLFPEYFIKFYYFYFFKKKKTGACELGCSFEFPQVYEDVALLFFSAEQDWYVYVGFTINWRIYVLLHILAR